jgi:transposase-like protein
MKDKLLAEGIRVKRLELELQQATIAKQIRDMQAICTHPNVNKSYHSNSGNYDPSADCEYYRFECPDCGKTWSEDK